jgi:hypothetical protein
MNSLTEDDLRGPNGTVNVVPVAEETSDPKLRFADAGEVSGVRLGERDRAVTYTVPHHAINTVLNSMSVPDPRGPEAVFLLGGQHPEVRFLIVPDRNWAEVVIGLRERGVLPGGPSVGELTRLEDLEAFVADAKEPRIHPESAGTMRTRSRRRPVPDAGGLRPSAEAHWPAVAEAMTVAVGGVIDQRNGWTQLLHDSEFQDLVGDLIHIGGHTQNPLQDAAVVKAALLLAWKSEEPGVDLVLNRMRLYSTPVDVALLTELYVHSPLADRLRGWSDELDQVGVVPRIVEFANARNPFEVWASALRDLGRRFLGHDSGGLT